MNTKPHTHHCGMCERDVDCHAARDGGCVFPSTSAMTCNPCAERATAEGSLPAAPRLTDDTPIFWDTGERGEEIVFLPELMSYDKHTVNWNVERHRYEGGYPF